jgi:uncharacterized protein YcbK (DUF882 family)
MKKKKKITKRRYILGFFAIVALLAIIRLIFPSIVGERFSDQKASKEVGANNNGDEDSLGANKRSQANIVAEKGVDFFNADGSLAEHPLKGVWSYKDCAPDSNASHLVAAKQFGVVPVQNIADAEKRKHELVYIGANPYYKVRKLQASIPYLVPRAAALLQDISRNFLDSLAVKHIPLQKLIITSVLRSKEDVVKLGKHNKNVSPNSCHVYGTTFDISYTHFEPLEAKVDDDRYKKTLSEVLRDMRDQNRCYVKYELHQACYHVTVR